MLTAECGGRRHLLPATQGEVLEERFSLSAVWISRQPSRRLQCRCCTLSWAREFERAGAYGLCWLEE